MQSELEMTNLKIMSNLKIIINFINIEHAYTPIGVFLRQTTFLKRTNEQMVNSN